MPRVKHDPNHADDKVMYGTRTLTNVWYADICDAEDSRRIRVVALKQALALRAAKTFCGQGEYVRKLLDHNKMVVWECTQESIQEQAKSIKSFMRRVK